PQNEYIERWRKQHGVRLDHEERARKKAAREEGHGKSAKAQNLRGLKAKLFAQERRKEKIRMKKAIKQHEERNIKGAAADKDPSNPVPAYLLDRNTPNTSKALSSSIKQARAEKAAKFSVPIPKVRGISEEELFKVVHTGKSKRKSWKRMVTKPTFVGQNFTRRNPKYERFIRPMGLRYKKAHVTHPELNVTVHLPILGGTVIEVNVSELGIMAGNKVAWGRYAQVTNSPIGPDNFHRENDGCVNAVLLV
ncbi:hypothetical protein PpBr36_00132, partial [Pyricularia pennisetigena]|uniref:hypothetical protein n=1 Tax=Pyricularia pennisetigena TaxID=1578925 RepID=UPI001152B6AF